MKKLLKLLFLFILIIPFIVKADVAPPAALRYDVTVVNQNGIDYYNIDLEKKGHLDEGTTLHIQSDYEANGELYLIFITDEENFGYVKSTDVIITSNGEVLPSAEGVSKTKKPKEVLIGEKDLDIKKGTSRAFETIGTIPAYTKLTFEYYILDYNPEDYLRYIYIDYNGIKGWIYSTDTVFFKTKSIWYDETEPFVVVKDAETKCGTVKKGTIFTDYWMKQYEGGSAVYYEKNGCKDSFETNKANNIAYTSSLYVDPKEYALAFDLDVYDYPFGNKIDKLKTGDMVKELNFYYDYPTEQHDINYYQFEYIEYNGKKGWIGFFHDTEDYISMFDYGRNSSNPNGPTGDVAPIPNKDEKKTSPSTLVIYCVIAGVAVALAAIVTIVLINKKKNKKEEVKEEKPVEQEEQKGEEKNEKDN